MPRFDDALAALPAPARARVEACFASWSDHAEWSQVAANVRRECALAQGHLEALLHRFADALAAAPTPMSEADWRATWCSACQPFELKGIEMPAAQRPARLGRAWRLASFASSIAACGQLTLQQAERLIRKFAGKLPPARQEAQIRAGNLGRGVMWATFHPGGGDLDPFSAIPETAASVQCALGLGCHRDRDILVLTYHTSAPGHGRPLHRPTVADASSYFCYRPHADAHAYHGYTEPLTPNLDKLSGMPEVVHLQVSGLALRFPYRIFV